MVATADHTDPWGGGHVGDLANASRLLADRLIAGLDDRPFCPTPDQLAWVWGGDLVRGETRAARARIAGGRYAALLADHVIEGCQHRGGAGSLREDLALRTPRLHREHDL